MGVTIALILLIGIISALNEPSASLYEEYKYEYEATNSNDYYEDYDQTITKTFPGI